MEAEWLRICFCNLTDVAVPVTIGDSLSSLGLGELILEIPQPPAPPLPLFLSGLLLQDPAKVVRLATVFMFSGDEFRRLPMESDSVAEEPVSSTLRLALSAISAKN